MAWLAAGAAFGGVGALAYLWRRRKRATRLPPPGGRYLIGRVGYHWVDAARAETLLGAVGRSRELMVWVWYPAAPATEAAPAAYLPEAWAAAEERERGVWALFNQRLDTISVHAIADAAVAPTERAYPVVLLQPGLGRSVSDYTVLAEALASYGYVVVGSTPTYSASVVVFPDGRIARATPQGSLPEHLSPDGPEGAHILDRLVGIWVADNRFVLNQLERLHADDPDERFTGRLDLHAVGVCGHSLGGASAVQTCASDARFRAGIDIDGELYGAVAQCALPRPCMFIWSDPPSRSCQAWWRARCDMSLAAPRIYQIVIAGARHLNFSDLAVLFSPGARLLGALGPIDGRRGLAISAEYLRAFFDRYLKNADSPLLNGPAPDYPEVSLESC
jgi:Platelet-activating factor acetylhydrolase, isoform II